jgi:hypothetical protein
MRRSVPVLATARSVTRLFPGAGVGVRRVQVARPVVSRRKSPIPQTHVALDRCAQCDRVLAPLRPSGREHYADVPRVADPVQRFIDTGGGQHVGGLHTREVVLDRGSGIVVDEQALPATAQPRARHHAPAPPMPPGGSRSAAARSSHHS